MKLGFLELSSDERRLYIEQAAIQTNVSPVIMEKDFWVCWLLGILFKSEFADSLVFKGGTSLSSQFFGSSWANYDLAKPGTFRLVPRVERLPALQRDYQSMRDMYLTKPISFDDVLAILSDLEHQINQERA